MLMSNVEREISLTIACEQQNCLNAPVIIAVNEGFDLLTIGRIVLNNK